MSDGARSDSRPGEGTSPDDPTLAQPAGERGSEEISGTEVLSTLGLGTFDLGTADSFLSPGGALRGPLFESLADTLEGTRPDDHLGPYRLIDRIGRGGMGEVWRAEQVSPVIRDVAIKLIKLGMDSEEVLARFHGERQALARMDHSNVARVYDAGATDGGRPYFVMELIQGEAVTHYCDEKKLTTTERLQLFLDICAGVEHAHQKGIIHRDLKPSNILVTEEADRPVPKIIDFGIAKAVGNATDLGSSAQTQLGQWVGTPEYMSPEQAGLRSDDIDTRSDVYALGAILYELLSGTQLFERDTLRRGDPEEMRRHIRERDPSKPSDRLSSSHTASEIAQRRGTEAKQLTRSLRGDLDWIVMKALEKDRDRRYASPRELAQDIERHLAHEPVVAGPPSLSYRASKFMRRHRLAVATAAIVTAAILGGTALATAGLLRARAAEQTAREAEQVARDEAAKTGAINRFLRNILSSASPEAGAGRDVTVVEALGHARSRLAQSFQDNPTVGADIRDTLGTTYHELGLHGEARELLEESLELRREALGDAHPDVAASLNELARLHHTAGEFDQAESYFHETLAVLRAAHGNEHSHVAATLNNLGMLYVHLGRQEEARETLESALELKRKLHGDVHREVMPTLNNLGMLLSDMGQHDEAVALFQEAIDGNRQIAGPRHGLVAINLTNLASTYHDQGRHAEAMARFEESLDIKREAFGDDHPSTAITLTAMAKTLDAMGEHEQAGPLHDEALAVFRAALEPDNFRIGSAQVGYGRHLLKLGNRAGAIEQMQEGVDILEAAFGADDPRVAAARESLREARD